MQYSVIKRADVAYVVLEGDFKENCESTLDSVVAEASVPIILVDLGRIRGFNSYGVGLLRNFLRSLVANAEVEIHRCSSSVIDAVNLAPAVLKGVRVMSLMVPIWCESCRIEKDELFDTKLVTETAFPPCAPCAKCGGGRVPHVEVSEYLGFLSE